MAANKFATMLHRNTNKLTLILIYAILEWVLILLLLLNSLFSYLIVKFADYFGLKRPCLWCSRLDHIFEPGNKSHSSYRDLVCEEHANEIAKLGFCSNHQKLAESQDMCEDCSSQEYSQEWSNKYAFFPWMKQIGMIQGGDDDKECSCCGVSLSNKLYPPCILLKPSWGVLDYAQKPILSSDVGVDAQTEEGDQSDQSGSDYVADQNGHDEGFVVVVQGNRGENSVSDVDGCCGQRDYDAEEKNNSACCSVCDYVCKETETEANQIEDEASMDDGRAQIQASCDENSSLHQHLEFYIDQDDCRLVPVELVDSPATIERQSHQNYKVDEDRAHSDTQDVILDFDMHFETQAKPVVELWYSSDEIVELLSSHESKEESKVSVLDSKGLDFDMHFNTQAKPAVECWQSSDEIVELLSSHESKEESKVSVLDSKGLDFDMHFKTQAKPVVECWQSSDEIVELLSSHEIKKESEVSVLDSKDLGQNGEEVNEQAEDTTSTQATPASCHEDDSQSNAADIVGRDIDSDVHQATTEDDDIHMGNDEIDTEVSIGTDIPDHDIFNEDIQSAHELLHSYPSVQEDPSTSSPNAEIDDNHGSKQEEEFLEFKTLSVETSEKEQNSYFSLGSELNEIEEEKVLPDTPTSIDNFHQLYNRMLLTERRESGTEASLDGSVVSDIECGDGVLTMEKLKSVLRAERKALNRVYAELEEERSASAIAANQTMAMINRLQEEKAAMQMEALQYQRMMDEQSEYDQEAMQLLNELMVKREKEKQELEKELEICRKKIQDYEAKEKMMILRRMKEGCTRSRTSSGPCSNAEDSDGLSIDLNHEVKEEDNLSGHEESSNQNTPRDAVLYLEESLASFEEEKLSILDQLKELEEKLLTLNDEEEEEHYEDIKPIDHFFSENGNGYHENGDVSSEENGIANGHSKEMNGTHHQDRKIMGSIKAKRLLPLFNEAEDEDEELNGDVEGYDSVASQDHKKLAIEEAVDHVYERLQALEADREFLKHCISSLRKGDKGLDLLQEILQHLRDLRSVETRLRNSGEGIL
ncbi:myosin-binding protein 2 [Rosa rugosa]|uniref:myosin-binding protein 2 n=1 Tax=Rosa rugosa TaxID=74645 RepID=UPI002B416BD1|nr:myosin-binding protein 2 [Rosa rugosa]